MKRLLLIILFIFSVTNVTSCKKGIHKQPTNSKGFEEIEKEIKEKFGNNPYFTELSISYSKKTGNRINLTVTKNPQLSKIEEWNNIKGNWNQYSEISFETPKGMKASDFMFQLDKNINLKRIGQLIELSKKSLKEEQHIKNSFLDLTFIKFPKNGDLSKTEFIVQLKQENNNTIFSFNYPVNETKS